MNLSNAEVAEAAENLYGELQAHGLEVLYDDRVDQTAGVKLNDADLLGLPVRLVVSPRNVRAGAVEIKRRTEGEAALVESGEVLAKVRELLQTA